MGILFLQILSVTPVILGQGSDNKSHFGIINNITEFNQRQVQHRKKEGKRGSKSRKIVNNWVLLHLIPIFMQLFLLSTDSGQRIYPFWKSETLFIPWFINFFFYSFFLPKAATKLGCMTKFLWHDSVHKQHIICLKI